MGGGGIDSGGVGSILLHKAGGKALGESSPLHGWIIKTIGLHRGGAPPRSPYYGKP